MQRLAIVVPCYNEEPVMEESEKQLTGVIQNLIDKNKIAPNSFVLFVNDGSKDRTWELIQKEYEKSKYVHGLNLAGNVGHQNALLAGLMTAKDMSDMCVSIDADLQDDVNVIEEMVDQYVSGYDIVYGVRSARKTDTFFKRTTAEGFYKVMKFMGIKSVYNHADYRLMSKRAVEQFLSKTNYVPYIHPIVLLHAYSSNDSPHGYIHS
jgi:polyisoprenyl-phosphate glycosyltransferase